MRPLLKSGPHKLSRVYNFCGYDIICRSVRLNFQIHILADPDVSRAQALVRYMVLRGQHEGTLKGADISCQPTGLGVVPRELPDEKSHPEDKLCRWIQGGS